MVLMASPAIAQVPFPEGTPPPAGGECPEGTYDTVNGCVDAAVFEEYLRAIGEGQIPEEAAEEWGANEQPAYEQEAAESNEQYLGEDGVYGSGETTSEVNETVLPATGGPAMWLAGVGALLLGGGLIGRNLLCK